MDDGHSLLNFALGFILISLMTIGIIYVFEDKEGDLSLIDSWISSDYEIYINGNPVIRDYTSLELWDNCYITGYPDEKKIVCKTKSNSSLFALDEALSQQYVVYVDGVKSEEITYSGKFLKSYYNVSINDESKQILCVRKSEVRRGHVYIPIPIRY